MIKFISVMLLISLAFSGKTFAIGTPIGGNTTPTFLPEEEAGGFVLLMNIHTDHEVTCNFIAKALVRNPFTGIYETHTRDSGSKKSTFSSSYLSAIQVFNSSSESAPADDEFYWASNVPANACSYVNMPSWTTFITFTQGFETRHVQDVNFIPEPIEEDLYNPEVNTTHTATPSWGHSLNHQAAYFLYSFGHIGLDID